MGEGLILAPQNLIPSLTTAPAFPLTVSLGRNTAPTPWETLFIFQGPAEATVPLKSLPELLQPPQITFTSALLQQR